MGHLKFREIKISDLFDQLAPFRGGRAAGAVFGDMPLLEKCLDSLENRAHPDPSKRDGVMGLDSSRTQGGTEITTYDRLDENGRFGRLIRALRKHTESVLKPGICIFEGNGGYRLSSTSRNSWLSKIYLSQHIIRHILGYEWGEQGQTSDAAHVDWLLDKDSAYFAWSDQMIDSKAIGSKYYPRGVTSILWLDEA